MMSWEEDDVSSLEATPRALKDATPLPFESPKARQRALRAIHGAPHVKTMPTIVPAVLPKHLEFLFERSSAPAAAEAVSAFDIFEKEELGEKMKSLSLKDHFDSFGKARFHHLGLTFAAKQLMPQQMARYGSVCQVPHTARKGDKSAKAFIMSQDQKRWNEHTQKILDAIQEQDRQKDTDVKERQVAILFSELPSFWPLLPSSVAPDSLEGELHREEDPQMRPAAVRQNRLLLEPQTLWRFRRNEVLVLVQVLKSWTLASWPKGGAEMGMDRASFCRFILDVGLADQRKVPFFWAVHLFDSCAKWMRYCAVDDPMPETAPLLQVVTWWELFPIVDALAQQHFRTTASNLRLKFIEQVAEIARFFVPSFAQKVINIGREYLELMLQGVGVEEEEKAPEEEISSRGVSKSRIVRVNSEKASGKVQLSILDDAQRQRMRSLLAEPEVLQLLWQHEEVFKGLHRSYCDDRGHISFASMVQLCSDFGLAPRLISLHALRKIYESLECLEVEVDADLERDSSLSMGKAKSHNPSRAGGIRQGRRSSMSVSSGASNANTGGSSPSARRSSISDAKKRATVIAFEKKPDLGTSSMGTSSVPTHSTSFGRRRGSIQAAMAFGSTAQERSGLVLPWEVISLRLREAARAEPTSGFLKVPALMEMLCKVAYTYLGCYGNMQQRSMSTLLQTVWLLTYLRFGVESLRSSLQRRKMEKEEEERRYGAVSWAVRRLRPDMWDMDDAPEFEDDMPAPCVKPLPKEVIRKSTKQASEAPKEGTPYVVDKKCQICKSTESGEGWGNLRCFACSKIDAIAFRRHPLAALLRRSGEKPVALAGKVPRVRNTSLSPPRFQENDTLRTDVTQDAIGQSEGGVPCVPPSAGSDQVSFGSSDEG
ncbi:unnamed protein product [Durusdinium trenchii]|uniref:Uncharacterized protein n=1 Tax=Durusdinium trenchii TaxID=1381693 RepID=A0ABP0SBI1_9DINO